MVFTGVILLFLVEMSSLLIRRKKEHGLGVAVALPLLFAILSLLIATIYQFMEHDIREGLILQCCCAIAGDLAILIDRHMFGDLLGFLLERFDTQAPFRRSER